MRPLVFGLVLLLGSLTAHAQRIVQKPIVFDAERKQLTLEYLKERYGLVQHEPTIVPKMVVVHWTVIPTFEASFNTFNKSRLPGHREAIKGASALNVSSQYLIDRDGTIYQLMPDSLMARHVIGLNHCAIGIENVGGGTDLPLTEAQLKANIELIKILNQRHDLEYVIGHYEYKAFIGHELWLEKDPDYLTQKTDPGEDFITNIRNALQGLGLKGPDR